MLEFLAEPRSVEEMVAHRFVYRPTAETPIADLKRHGYPWLSETCFFSVARDPYEWVMSAANHMNVTISSRYGFFDHANIQSYMTGYGAGDHGAAFVCVGTLDHFLDVEHGLFPLLPQRLVNLHFWLIIVLRSSGGGLDRSRGVLPRSR